MTRTFRISSWSLVLGVALLLATTGLQAAPVTMAVLGPRVLVPGMTSSSVSYGDTWDGAWLASGDLYLQQNDGVGFNTNAPFVHDRVSVLRGTPEVPASLSGTNLNPGTLSNTFSGSPCYSTGIYEVDGVLYHLICYSNQTTFTFNHTSIIKSVDGGANWTNAFGQKNVMPPDTLSGSTFPSDAWGEVNFVKYGAGGVAPAVDNAQNYVYLCSEGKYLARVGRTELPRLDRSLFQFYKGGDGMADSNWTNDISQATSITPNLNTWATAMTYNPALGRYVMTADLGNSWVQPPIQGVLSVMEAPHPWGPWTMVLQENMTPKEHDNIAYLFTALGREQKRGLAATEHGEPRE